MSEDEARTHVLAGAPTLDSMSAELVVVRGSDLGARLRLRKGTVRIGTGSGNDLRLTDTTVSRVHCEIRSHRADLRIVDLASTNGTFVDDVRVRDAQLAIGSTLRVGGTTVRVEGSESPFSIELSMRESFGGVIGSSVEMRQIYALLERAAPTPATVLVEGETGTGKELVARAIHDHSPRAAGPFVTADCGALSESLIESELFGHVRGAFTGATHDRRGLVEEAHGGTLFLDEIGELPSALQPKLLRMLEAREVRRVGGNVAKKVDVRVVAATNRSLAHRVNEGTFREDLYYRLAVVELQLPPLRARREDIPMLAQHFYARFTSSDRSMPVATLRQLMARAWPGNVRELRNHVERSVTLGPTIGGARTSGLSAVASTPLAADLEKLVPTHLPLRDARLAWTEQFERLYVSALLRKTAGNVTHAAALAGVNRRSLQRLIAQMGIRGPNGELLAEGDED